MAAHSALSPEPQTLVFSNRTLVLSKLPLLEPRGSCSEQVIVCWPFKRVPVSSRLLSLPGIQNPHQFSKPDVMWAPLFVSGALGWEAQRGLESLNISEGSFAAEISLWDLSHHLWEQLQLVLHFCPPYQS